jgi:predicted NACHT family NTPase
MMSYTASQEGIEKAKLALKHYGKSKTYLAGEAGGISRTVVNNFFTGKTVSCDLFQNICQVLGLDWRLIADMETEKTEASTDVEIDDLVKTIRQQVSADILARCGTMRILDMEQPIEYSDIYTGVNILEKISGRSRLEYAEMLAICQDEGFDRLMLGKVKEERVPGLVAVDRYSKLMILGKPGAGKTTFMKRLAMLCRGGDFQGNQVPIFVTLKDFAEAEGQPGLLAFIDRQWSACGITASAEDLLNAGRALVLLDGLDEVRDIDHDRVLALIKDFSHQYRDCLIVITCRIAAREYTFERFTEIEVADFNEEQIAAFINKWFAIKKDLPKAARMIEKLKARQPVQELATNPLLLTLLCWIFGEGADFPSNRSELYKEGLDVLLKKWDGKRNIERGQVYEKLSLTGKENLLSQLAFDTFDRGEYFFKQSTAERYIADYICNIPGSDDKYLQLDSEAVLKSIMAQHGLLVERAKGVFSFSHLTFHEYFAAKRIVDSSIAKGGEAFQSLASHAGEQRWQEVFFLVLGMLPDASFCLLTIKKSIDQILVDDVELQKYLVWLDEKCQSIDHRPATMAYLFYLGLSSGFDLGIGMSLDLSLDFYLYLVLHLNFYLNLNLNLAINQSKKLEANVDFTDILQSLRQQLPKESVFDEWAKENLANWRQQLCIAMIQYRNIDYGWQFTSQQQEKLGKHYLANKLLSDILKLETECYIDRTTRQYIINTFCRPLALISPPPL